MTRIAVIGALLGLLGCGSPPASEGDAGVAHDARPSTRDAQPSDTDAAPVEQDCAVDGDGRTTLVFVNGCSRMLEMRGSDIEGATIAPGTIACRDIGSAEEELSAKRYWGFLGDDPGPERHTLAELTFNTDFHDFDWYNISHVDAHNLTMRITPLARPDCDTLVCDDPALLTECPDVGRVEDASGELVSCVSPDRDDPESEVALYFESCDDGYAWSGDDQRGEDPSPVRACAGEDWEIVFCP
ncbi:thaumatin family protein [Sandaracinus amylolyticus]|uniref:thaumatin family protein n=1 Tax=Sandaracinus amylolyticus TaxID=927083 RepID=UPI001F3F2539|nr:thaumatin family protein [Sandaracinus amylolyticus]UJR85493.1 Hypothetical protein I5071_75730 [Sandaracinus amylolyticus]